ncbi:MAG: sulfatase-like hydrolase/transferase [Verrucomicrobia bacterium]|nr:sulfatase-like hydrolase/transferase [Verrucomicrobiota bacterium]
MKRLLLLILLAFAGHPVVKTPNLDKFASRSTWFRQFYVAATGCSPSRCAFMASLSPACAFRPLQPTTLT